jgi:hypothetical protein
MENFSGAQLSAFAPMRHTSRNPYLRIADIGADRFGPTLKGGKTLSLCVPACGMQRIFTQFKKHPPAFIPIGCCLYRHRIHAREQDRLHAGSFAPSQGIEQGLRAGRELLSGRKEAREQRDAYPWTYASFPNSSR